MKIHTIQLNIEDFESGTMHMDATEKGVYLSLMICLYKISTHKLPNNDTRLARMAGVNLRKWKTIKPNIIDKFIVTDSFWEHKRVSDEVVKYQKLSHKNRANALNNNNSPEPVAKPNTSQTAANTSNYNLVTNNKNKDKNSINPQTPTGAKTKKLNKKGCRIPDDWDCSEELGEWAMAQGMVSGDVVKAIDGFIDHYKAATGKGSTALDWNAKFRTWIRNNLNWKENRK